jgi:hypothetical protein
MLTYPPQALEVVDFRGKRLDRVTVAAIEDAERKLGRELSVITQGSYNTTVAASGGTHAGGGVFDNMPPNLAAARAEERALRSVGFMAYVRPRLVRADGSVVWNLHVHAGLLGHPKASPALRAQFVEYLKGGDALVGSAPDTGPRDFTRVRYRWERGAKRITRARARLDRVLEDLAAYDPAVGRGVRGYAVGAARKAARQARAALPAVPTDARVDN